MEVKMDRWEEYKEAREGLRREYDLVANQWRFIKSGRLIFLGIIATAFAALFSGYGIGFNLLAQGGVRQGVGTTIVFVVCVAGTLISSLAFLVELVLAQMINAATLRAATIENDLGIVDGIFGSILQGGLVTVRGIRITIPGLLNGLFLLLTISWLSLLVTNIFNLR